MSGFCPPGRQLCVHTMVLGTEEPGTLRRKGKGHRPGPAQAKPECAENPATGREELQSDWSQMAKRVKKWGEQSVLGSGGQRTRSSSWAEYSQGNKAVRAAGAAQEAGWAESGMGPV